MKTTILTAFILLLNFTAIMSQTRNEVSFDVAGLNPYGKPTDKEVRAALGQPTRYSTRNSEFGEGRTYQYGPVEKYDLFRYDAFGEVLDFVLKTPTYSLFNGRIKVGSSISKFSNLGGGLLEKKAQNMYYFHPLGIRTESYLKVRVDEYGTIIKILFSPPV